MSIRSNCIATDGLDELTDSRLLRIDQLCDGFEMAWKMGRPPRIETFLDDLTGESLERAALLRELVVLETEYRRQAGEALDTADYHARFPELERSWLDAHLLAATMPLPVADDRTDLARGDQKPDATAESPARQLGKFRLLEKVGVGAFGAVWRALDLALDRVVALKIPHAHLIEGDEEVARFHREARVIAQLRHPGIVPVHEVMVLDGLPIMVCDYVTGTSLRDLLAKERLTPRAAAQLVARVADTLAYAHAMGAIHRDVKPANIMTDRTFAQPRDGGTETKVTWPGEPRLVDFGLAFLDDEAAQLTHDGAVIGTPAYMSPEQASGRDPARPIDHRTDIYSLGVVLYELLTGKIPFSGSRSDVLAQVVGSEPPSPRSLDRSVSRDLESICLKAMAKEPRHRYASARAMADDLRHYLDGEPVRARPISLWQRFLRRAHRRPAEAALVLMAAVTCLAVSGMVLGQRYQRRLEREIQATDLARAGEAVQRQRAEEFLYFQRMALAEREWTANNIDRVERLLEECPANLRGWEWRYLKRQCRHDLLTLDSTEAPEQSWTVTAVRFSGDGRRIASANKGGSLLVWDAASGRRLRKLGNLTRPLFALAFQPGGALLAASGEDGMIRVWDPESGRLAGTIPTGSDTIYALAYSPDGKFLASGHGYPALEEVDHMRGKGVIRVWNVATGELVHTLRGHTQNLMGLAFSPDGQTLASVSGSWLAVPQAASRPGEMILWDARTGKMIREAHGHGGPLTGVAYDPTGALIATSSWDCTVKLWDARTGDPRRSLAGHQDWVLSVAFSPDGTHLATAGADGAIKIWDHRTSEDPYTLRGHTKNVTCLAFSPDGRRLASGSSDQTIKLWDSAVSQEALTWRKAGGPIARVAFFPDGRRLLVAANQEAPDGRVHPRLVMLDVLKGLNTRAILRRDEGVSARPIDGIAIRGDGQLLAAASLSGRIEVRAAPHWRSTLFHDEPTSRFQAVAISPDGRTLAAAGQVNAHYPNGEAVPNVTTANALVILFDLESGSELWRDAGADTGIIRDLAFSPDGLTLATADNVGTVTLRDAASGQVRNRLRGHRRVVSRIAFSPDGEKLASASWDSTVAVWSLSLGLPVARLQGHMRSVLCVTFSPDGRRLATSSEDRTVRLWDVQSGQELITLRGHTDIVTSVAFSPDGNRLASAGADGTVQIREAVPAAEAGTED